MHRRLLGDGPSREHPRRAGRHVPLVRRVRRSSTGNGRAGQDGRPHGVVVAGATRYGRRHRGVPARRRPPPQRVPPAVAVDPERAPPRRRARRAHPARLQARLPDVPAARPRGGLHGLRRREVLERAAKRCRNGSLLASATMAVDLTVHTLLRSYRHVDAFVCPSRFLAGQMERGHVFPDRMHVIRHFIDLDGVGPQAVAGRQRGNRGAHVGREGDRRRHPGDRPPAGAGPPGHRRRRTRPGRAGGLGRHARTRPGHLPRPAAEGPAVRPAAGLVRRARAEHLVREPADGGARGPGHRAAGHRLRSGWAPRAGGRGHDGLLVPPGDDKALATAIGDLLSDPARAFAMGQNGHARSRRTSHPRCTWNESAGSIARSA